MAKKDRKIRLKRSILLPGEKGEHEHMQKGTVISADPGLCAQLVGDGSAEYHEDSLDEVVEETRRGVTVHEPAVQTRDPQVKVEKPAPKANKA